MEHLEGSFKLIIFFLQFSRLYHGVKRASNPPHIFAAADAAYQCMVTFSKDQVRTHLPFLSSHTGGCVLSSSAALKSS